MKESMKIFNDAMIPSSEKREEGVDKYYLFNNGDVCREEFPLPDILDESLINALVCKKYPYSNPAGHLESRKKVARYEGVRNKNPEISQKNICITMGATNGLDLAIKVVKNNIGEGEVLIPRVSYPVANEIAKSNGFSTKLFCTKRENNFLPSVDDIKESITKSTKLLILTSPNNPTGSEYTKKEIQKISDFCKQEGIYLIIDEIFSGLMLNNNEHPIPEYNIEDDNVIRINGWSKDRGVAGFRIGYVVASSGVIEKVKNLINISYGNAPTLFNRFIIKDMSHRASMAENRKTRNEEEHILYKNKIFSNLKKYENNEKLVKEILSGIHRVIDYTQTQGGFCKFVKFDTNEPDEVFTKNIYKNTGVALVPGESFNPTEGGWARITFSQPQDTIEEGLNALKRYCNK